MPELTPELTTEHRLSVIETDIKYLAKGQDELIQMVKAMRDAKCDGNCDVGKEVAAIKSSLGTYKKWTWASFLLIITAGIKSVLP